MKKRLFAFLFIFGLLLGSFACAQDTSDTGIADASSTGTKTSSGFNTTGFKDIGSKTNTALATDIKVPENLQIFARVIFGIKGEIPLQIFIVLACVWTVLFVLISGIIKITPLFGRGNVIPWVIGFIVTCLVSLSGAVRSVAVFLFNLGNIFGFLEKWSALKIVIAIIISALFAWGGSILIKKINESVMSDKAETVGAEAGAGARMMKESFKQATGIRCLPLFLSLL